MISSIAIAWRRLVTVLFRPSAVAEEIRAAPASRDGAVAVAQLGVVWAVFCAALFAAGHGPSFSLLPIPKGTYYAAQAVFVVPLTLALWWLMSAIAARVAGAKDASGRAMTFAALGYAYAAPLIFVFLLVDVILYASMGFDALGRYIRFYAPIAPLWAVVAGTLVLRRALGISTARALLATAAGMIAQALLGGVLLR
jgi:hypothetical protein